MNEKCPNCGSHLVKYVEREEIVAKSKKIVYRDTVSFRCDKCKTETDLDIEADPRKTKKRLQLIENGFLTDIDIKKIRKKLGLSQKEMAQKLGVGLKNFARYENLSVRQSKAMDSLLRILDVYPDTIKVLEGQAIDVKKDG